MVRRSLRCASLEASRFGRLLARGGAGAPSCSTPSLAGALLSRRRTVWTPYCGAPELRTGSTTFVDAYGRYVAVALSAGAAQTTLCRRGRRAQGCLARPGLSVALPLVVRSCIGSVADRTPLAPGSSSTARDAASVREREGGGGQARSRSRCRRRQGAARALGVCECSKCSIDARGFDGFASLAPHVMASELVSAACGRRPRDAAER